MQYRDNARDLVRLFLDSHGRPDTLIYAVGYLYRHAIELHLKAIIVRSPGFRDLSLADQRKSIEGHSIHGLWNKARVALDGLVTLQEVGRVEKVLLELHNLDAGSDGFRYPFKFVSKEGKREPTLRGLAFASFDNFVWVLDGICSWLHSTADAEEWQRDFERWLQEQAAD